MERRDAGGGNKDSSNGYTRICNERRGWRQGGMLRRLKMCSDETLNILTPSAETINWLLMRGRTE